VNETPERDVRDAAGGVPADRPVSSGRFSPTVGASPGASRAGLNLPTAVPHSHSAFRRDTHLMLTPHPAPHRGRPRSSSRIGVQALVVAALLAVMGVAAPPGAAQLRDKIGSAVPLPSLPAPPVPAPPLCGRDRICWSRHPTLGHPWSAPVKKWRLDSMVRTQAGQDRGGMRSLVTPPPRGSNPTTSSTTAGAISSRPRPTSGVRPNPLRPCEPCRRCSAVSNRRSRNCCGHRPSSSRRRPAT
jgi:hypothetical protein